MPSYLDDTFLGGAEDGNYEIGAADHMPAVAQDAMTPAPAAKPGMIRLPGGIMLPKKTAFIIAVVIALAFAIWWWKSRQAKKD